MAPGFESSGGPMGTQPTSDDAIVCDNCMATFSDTEEGREAFEAHECEPPACSEDGCTDDAPAEARLNDAEEWEAVCKHHAHGALALGHQVRSLADAEADR